MNKRKDNASQIKKEEHINPYKEEIAEMVWQIEDVWILKQIHKFIISMTKEGS